MRLGANFDYQFTTEEEWNLKNQGSRRGSAHVGSDGGYGR